MMIVGGFMSYSSVHQHNNFWSSELMREKYHVLKVSYDIFIEVVQKIDDLGDQEMPLSLKRELCKKWENLYSSINNILDFYMQYKLRKGLSCFSNGRYVPQILKAYEVKIIRKNDYRLLKCSIDELHNSFFRDTRYMFFNYNEKYVNYLLENKGDLAIFGQKMLNKFSQFKEYSRFKNI